MSRTIAVIAVSLSLAVTALHAEEVKGIVKKRDTAKNSLTLTIEGKDQTFGVSKDASFVSVNSEIAKKGKRVERVAVLEKGLAGVSDGANVTVMTESEGGKDIIVSVKVSQKKEGGSATNKKTKKNKKKS